MHTHQILLGHSGVKQASGKDREPKSRQRALKIHTAQMGDALQVTGEKVLLAFICYSKLKGRLRGHRTGSPNQSPSID